MDYLVTFGRTLGFSFAAGINLYATVAILGLASRFGWVALPSQFAVFDNNYIIGAALVMYVIEFVADKIPWVDTIWDMIHTIIRPIGGALIAVATLGEASPAVDGLVALLGGTVAASTHMTKAGSRAIVNASPEPFSNWILSLAEDVFVVGLGFVALKYPLVALAVALVLLVLIVLFARILWRGLRRASSGQPVDASSPARGRPVIDGRAGYAPPWRPPAGAWLRLQCWPRGVPVQTSPRPKASLKRRAAGPRRQSQAQAQPPTQTSPQQPTLPRRDELRPG